MASHVEPVNQFESRKRDHIRLSLDPKNQVLGGAGLDRVELIHEALPDFNFSDITIVSSSLGAEVRTPFLISSMTAGHMASRNLNARLAKAAEHFGWRMGVGSQRKELADPEAAAEWKKIRKSAPNVQLYGNLGLAQLVRTKMSAIEKLVESLAASGMIIHLNSLQECLQPEGTPEFRDGAKALKKLCQKLSVPVIVKETGCGFSKKTLKRFKGMGIGCVDVSGFGGTHWGRIEGDRNPDGAERRAAAETFADWGISTVDSLRNAVEVRPDYEVWASGGVRTGLDAAKLLAMGAATVGYAMPILEAALKGDEVLFKKMSTIEFELKTAMFCTGIMDMNELQTKKVWKWRDK